MKTLSNLNLCHVMGQNSFVRTTEDNEVHTPHVEIDGIPANHIDAFSRIRVSAPSYRFDSQFTYQIDSDLWDTATISGTGSVTYDSTNRCAVVSSDSGVAGHNVIQSHYHAPYTPGRSQLAILTFCFGASLTTAGEERGVGYYDGTNGVYLVQKSTGVHLGLDSSTANGDELIAQASWNVDPMNGTGPSGLTLDLTKTQILVISLQALYAGRVTVGFDIEGTIYPIHIFDHSNMSPHPYIGQASLPVRYWTKSAVASAADVTMDAICASVISEGGAILQDMQGRPFASYGTLSNAASGTILVIRCKQQLNSINQNAIVAPTDINVTVGDAACWIEIRRNATVSAGTFTSVDASSTVEESFAGNVGTDPVVTAGTGVLIDKFYVSATASTRASSAAGLLGKVLLSYSHLLGAGDTLSVIYNGGGATTDVFASLKWKEIR